MFKPLQQMQPVDFRVEVPPSPETHFVDNWIEINFKIPTTVVE